MFRGLRRGEQPEYLKNVDIEINLESIDYSKYFQISRGRKGRVYVGNMLKQVVSEIVDGSSPETVVGGMLNNLNRSCVAAGSNDKSTFEVSLQDPNPCFPRNLICVVRHNIPERVTDYLGECIPNWKALTASYMDSNNYPTSNDDGTTHWALEI